VVATNKARKARLLAIAKDRLGYQEYVEAREALDKNILALFTKLQKKDGPKVSKKKKAKSETNGSVPPPPSTPPIGAWPSAAGLGPDDENMLQIPDALAQLVATRRQWVDSIGGVFETMEQEQPGRIYGLPERSIYEGLDADIDALMGRTDSDDGIAGRSASADKGKGRAVGEAMDVDR
jgi:transcriptional adapter 3